MSTKVGQELDLGKIREDIKAISRMGYFRDVTIDSEEEQGGFRLTVFVVGEADRRGGSIEGNKDVEQNVLREALTIKERSLFSEDKVKESVNKLKEVFQNQGFIDAKVESSVTEEPDGSIRVTFRISEGEKLKIERIVITGNLYFSRKEILEAIETNEEGILLLHHPVRRRQEGRPGKRHPEDRGVVPQHGFLDSKIFDPQFQKGKNGLVLTIRVFEGKQYRLGEIRFTGESGLPEETLRKTVKLKSGDLFNRETLVSDLLALTTLVNDEGYAQALVSPGVDKRKEYPVADVTYRIDRGTKFRFGKVEIDGNTKTYDRVVRRRLQVSEGRRTPRRSSRRARRTSRAPPTSRT